jgi:hypothetical protein
MGGWQTILEELQKEPDLWLIKAGFVGPKEGATSKAKRVASVTPQVYRSKRVKLDDREYGVRAEAQTEGADGPKGARPEGAEAPRNEVFPDWTTGNNTAFEQKLKQREQMAPRELDQREQKLLEMKFSSRELDQREQKLLEMKFSLKVRAEDSHRVWMADSHQRMTIQNKVRMADSHRIPRASKVQQAAR